MQWREYELWREGVVCALDGGLWLHRFVLRGDAWAHLVSSDREVLLDAGRALDMPGRWLQYRPIKDPRTGVRVDAWHWDMGGERLRRAVALAAPRVAHHNEVLRT